MKGMTLRCALHADARVQSPLAWSPSGRFLAAPLEGPSIAIWELDNDEPVAVLDGHGDAPSCVAWSPDGKRLLSGGFEGSVTVWNVESGAPIRQLAAQEHDGGFREVLCVAWHPSGALVASGGVDAAVVLWDPESGLQLRAIEGGAAEWVYALVWSPDGRMLAAGSQGESVRVWDGSGTNLLWDFQNVAEYTSTIAWSPSGEELAGGYQAKSVMVFDPESGQVRNTLEGYVGEVTAVSFSADGRALATADETGLLRFWDADGWAIGPTRPLEHARALRGWNGLAFHPELAVLATVEDGEVRLWDLEWESLFEAGSASPTVRFTSAKIVLVGESNVGKSCLAMRLSEDRYPSDEEQATTHGMRFWPLDAERLHPGAAAPEGHRRDVVLWDFGGQHEYRLVHQLFLQDTTLALVLFDPTRGAAAIDDVRDWNTRLERHLSDRGAIKLLIGAKQDDESPLIDRAAIDAVRDECGFRGYVEVSARTERNISALRQALADALDWDALATTSRPELFQQVRDHIEIRRAAGDVVLLVDDVSRAIEAASPELYDEAAVETVAGQLAVQGAIAQTTLTEGARALVLQVPVIERYAGSLIVAARSNPRGVPALEERLLGSPALPLPGIKTEERLPRLDERVILECVAELMIQHGLCFRHEGLLIFPSLFPVPTQSEEGLEHSVSLYYDFTGAIDNIYASLVARLVLSEEFGHGRLYPSRVEFDQPGQGVCGIRQITRSGGLAHLDLFFSESTVPEHRALFGRFVADHLRSHGVVIREHQTIRCRGCGREIAEDVVQTNVAAGEKDVVCAWCRTLTLISEGVATDPRQDLESERQIYALRMEVDRRARADSERTKAAVAGGGTRHAHADEPIRLLHLSDLHFTGQTSPDAKAQWLLQDLRTASVFDFESVEYLVISGDITDRGADEGFEQGRRFVALLNDALGISAERCIFVPGNHDVQDVEEAYDWYASAEKARRVEPDETRWHREGAVVFVPNPERYADRLRTFSDAFFHKVIQRPYPQGWAQQGLPYLFPETGIQFLTLNSCWHIDQFHRGRAAIHPDAVAHVVAAADDQVREAAERGRIADPDRVLRIGLWHHALQHPEMIRNVEFASILQRADVRLALHGDVHEMNRDRFKYWHEKTMHIAGAGSFGSPKEGRPESMPRLYNLLEIARDLRSVRVHTRRQLTPDGAWDGWNEWPLPEGEPGGRPFYDLELS